MKVGNIKGALLEYIVRNLFKKSGFTNVKPDNLYTYESKGLFFVNGRGAAHDADIIMNPPIQMPFTYPTQLIFECKAYSEAVGLPVVRGALGLRNDLNEFEIVTTNFLTARKNNRKAGYAIENRNRFLYQVGVASVNPFSSPAIEFAANSKIPLLTLSWFLSPSTIKKFNDLKQSHIDDIDSSTIENVFKFLKDRNGDMYHSDYRDAYLFFSSTGATSILGDIITEANFVINTAHVALLETGDILFIFSRGNFDIFTENTANQGELIAQIHWQENRPNIWSLQINNSYPSDLDSRYEFFLPENLIRSWDEYGRTPEYAIELKQRNFERIFVFNNRTGSALPFSIVTIDKGWLERAQNDLNKTVDQ